MKLLSVKLSFKIRISLVMLVTVPQDPLKLFERRLPTMTHPGTQPIKFLETPEPSTAGTLFQDAGDGKVILN